MAELTASQTDVDGARRERGRMNFGTYQAPHDVPHVQTLVPQLCPRICIRRVETGDVAVLFRREERGWRGGCMICHLSLLRLLHMANTLMPSPSECV